VEFLVNDPELSKGIKLTPQNAMQTFIEMIRLYNLPNHSPSRSMMANICNNLKALLITERVVTIKTETDGNKFRLELRSNVLGLTLVIIKGAPPAKQGTKLATRRYLEGMDGMDTRSINSVQLFYILVLTEVIAMSNELPKSNIGEEVQVSTWNYDNYQYKMALRLR
tara:strand:- start:236618 stop:237118 length:501 start_codon:yes stop_codon:yes gene_type:complete